MDDSWATREALFRYSVIGGIVSRPLLRGELTRTLSELAGKNWTGPDGRTRIVAAKTLEEWFYRYKKLGFEGLKPQPRSDRGTSKVLSPEIQELILAMKREDPGRSAPLILRELVLAGRLNGHQVSVSAIQRLLRRKGLSGPRLELERPARLRWQASACGELWQGDCLHGPKLFDPASGREVRVKIFALIDDRSRLVTYLRAGFEETQAAFLAVLMGAVLRRGIPFGLLLDNHGSFTGSDVELACAMLGVRLNFAKPYDGPAKGKIERWWRHLREHVLDRLDSEKVRTLDDLNVRLWAWVEGEYNKKPHSSLAGKTPLEVWEEDSEEVRWVEDNAPVEKAFTARMERTARNDSTCQVRGRHYEVPTHLRGRTVKIGYSLLFPERLWVEDGETRVPLREVDPEGNARRSREKAPAPPPAAPKTGLNAVEEFLKRVLRPEDGKEGCHA
jgi:putative transposase